MFIIRGRLAARDKSARDGSGYAAKGRMSFCAAGRGSQRKRPWRRHCKSQRTQAAFERTARRLRREERLARGRSVGRSASRGAAAARTSAPGGWPDLSDRKSIRPRPRGFAAGPGRLQNHSNIRPSAAGSARRRRPERRKPGAQKINIHKKCPGSLLNLAEYANLNFLNIQP